MLRAESVSYRAGNSTLLEGVSLTVEPARLHAVIGPNGAGKSTLLKLLSGDLLPCSGRIDLNNRPLQQWSARERACLRAVLPQNESLRFGFSVTDIVQLGRLSSGQLSPERENEIVHEALATAGVEALASRRYPTLSGGERARVQLARVLAQVWTPTPLGERYLLLDEPTASLDLAHQHACLRALRKFLAQGVGAFVILHDPNLAMAYADQVSLLHHGRLMLSGTPQQVLTPDNMRAIYGVEVDILRSTGGGSHIAVHR